MLSGRCTRTVRDQEGSGDDQDGGCWCPRPSKSRLLQLCSSHLGAVRLDKALLLRYSSVLRKGTSRQLHSLQKKFTSTTYKFHRAALSTTAERCSPTAPNEPQRLANLRAFFTRWARRRECVARLDNTLWRWAELPPLSHGNATPQSAQ